MRYPTTGEVRKDAWVAMKLFEAIEISVRYPDSRTRALRGFSASFAAGRTYALVGDNGAGKTTFARAACGLVPIESGTFLVDGIPQKLLGPRDAERVGIGMVSQRSTLADGLSVAENALIGVEPRIAGVFTDRKEARKRTASLAGEFGFALDPDEPVEGLSLAQRREVELLRAAARGARVLILDEPTAQLGFAEVESVFSLVRKATSTGRIVLYVSHRLDEVAEIADEVLIIRSGRVTERHEGGALDAGRLAATLSRSAKPAGPPAFAVRPSPSIDMPAVIRLKGVGIDRHAGGGIEDIGLALERGEIACVVALAGNGAEALEELVAGIIPPDRGSIEFATGVGARRVIPWIPSDRDRYAIAPDLRGDENAVARERSGFGGAAWLAFGLASLVGAPKESRATGGAIAARAKDILGGLPAGQRLAAFSGGMRQRLVIRRELAGNPAFALAGNPFQGLDERQRMAMIGLMREKASSGTAILAISPSIEDALDLGGRVFALYKGRLGECPRQASALEAAICGGSHA
jgi:simple sugar transport system ATP-binding protein